MLSTIMFDSVTKDTFMSDCKVEKAKLQEMLKEKKVNYETQHQTLATIAKSSEDKLNNQLQGMLWMIKKLKKSY